MVQRRKKDKTKSAIRTKECQFDHQEKSEDRHQRRLKLAIKHSDRLKGYCNHKGYELKISQEGKHFVINRKRLHIDWYPYSAKMIVNYQNGDGIHVHEVSQIISYLEFAWLLFGGKNNGFF